MYGSKNDFASFILNSLQRHESIDVIYTLIGNHTYIPHLAEALSRLVELPVLPGIIHLASEDVCSRYDFALALANEFGLDVNLIHAVETVPEWKAERPTKGGLRTGLAIKLGLPTYTILDGIKEYHRTVEA